MQQPLVSIITVSRNAAHTIDSAIRSVLSQDYQAIEYIVLDGDSTDGTQAVIEQFQDRITYYTSEEDKGLYDALNKGLKLARGEIIGILHSDDFYAHKHVINRVVAAFRLFKTQTIYADLEYVDGHKPQRTIRRWTSGGYRRSRFMHGWMPPHPTLFVRREVYEKHGDFNLYFKSAADYEFMLRILFKRRVSSAYVPEVFIKMRTGGLSNASWKHRLKANREDHMAWLKNGLIPPPHTLMMKPIRKLPQYLPLNLPINRRKRRIYEFNP